MGGWQHTRRVCAAAVGIVLLSLGGATLARATQPPRTLWQRSFEAEIVVHARIVHPRWEIPLGDPPTPYPVVEADVLEVLRGNVAPGRLTFARDGHEHPPYTSGQDTVLFLRPITASPALAETAVAASVQWASLPTAVENLHLTEANRTAHLTAIRSYTAIADMPQSAERGARLRTLTIELVVSPEPALTRSALRDLALAGNAPLLTRAEAGRIGELVFDPTVPIETRLALLHETERRGLVFGPTAWARMLRETHGAELGAVMRAVRGHHSVAVNLELERMLKGEDRALALAAAFSLGSFGNTKAVRPLLRELDTPDPAFRHAIVRALGGIGTQGARQALDLVATNHPNPGTRHIALTEVLMLARRHGTTLAPMFARTERRQSTAKRRPLSTARAAQASR